MRQYKNLSLKPISIPESVRSLDEMPDGDAKRKRLNSLSETNRQNVDKETMGYLLDMLNYATNRYPRIPFYLSSYELTSDGWLVADLKVMGTNGQSRYFNRMYGTVAMDLSNPQQFYDDIWFVTRTNDLGIITRDLTKAITPKNYTIDFNLAIHGFLSSEWDPTTAFAEGFAYLRSHVRCSTAHIIGDLVVIREENFEPYDCLYDPYEEGYDEQCIPTTKAVESISTDREAHELWDRPDMYNCEVEFPFYDRFFADDEILARELVKRSLLGSTGYAGTTLKIARDFDAIMQTTLLPYNITVKNKLSDEINIHGSFKDGSHIESILREDSDVVRTLKDCNLYSFAENTTNPADYVAEVVERHRQEEENEAYLQKLESLERAGEVPYTE